ncbi:aldehyde dehydrogenase [Haloplanus aerogenes]|uniref:Aldehyde dehydrogenase n=1 Tax=Haloplanus aerogenes TaxID=660522 RepID=A0A3M0DS66_9EURY|nr:aldehyde dehydrogenase [Haloplanus aerogenes]AZH25338.1 aldehyde dehydrogenase [Haloplanus aerogenes]RMB25035.1 aldehyde dehydrogenase (NAD+) [Haloplanus aerogenes]
MDHTELLAGREYGMIVDGERVDATAGERFDVTYPYDGTAWASVPEATAEDVDAAVDAARRRFESDDWQDRSATERGQLLFALADEIEAHTEELAHLESLSNGKLIREMRGQVESLPDWYRYYGGLADKVQGDTMPIEQDGFFGYTKPEPYGVVGAITTWNSPLSLATYKIAPAIAAGNTVVLKPSELAPVSAIRLAELALDAGFPPGALNVVTGFAEAGAALAGHEDIDRVALTGGPTAGKAVAKAAAENVVPSTLELGGKSPNIVFPDADLDTAVTGAIKGIFAASGQTCIAGSRLFLHESIADDFLDRLIERTEAISLGDPLDEATEMGPIVSAEQLAGVRDHVDRAVDDGATLLTGGEEREVPDGPFYPPTILGDVTNDMAIAREEVFGPVLAVLTFESEDEVIEKANDSEFGLAAGVWTTDIRRGHRMADQLEAGVVWLNTYRKSSFTMPFGGFKQSGMGVEKGIEAIDEYLQTKSVWVETEGEISDPFRLV